MSGQPSAQRILLLAPHQDDECLQTAGVIYQAVRAGAQVSVCFATNGEYANEADAAVRAAESLQVLSALGVPPERVIFLGYPDTGMPYQESFLRRLYDGKTVAASRWGRTETWRPDGQDFRFQRSGRHGTYTAQSVLQDLRDVLETVQPDAVYVTAPGDCHGDHDALGRFTVKVAAAMEHPPALYYYLIHADRTDTWPERGTPHFALPPLEAGHPLLQCAVEHRPLPEGFSPADKYNLIQRYSSQEPAAYDGYLLAFAKHDELLFRVERLPSEGASIGKFV